jgi:hypothetical protein
MGMQFTGLLVNFGKVLADFNALAAMGLVGRHESDAAMPLFVILPVDKRHDPSAGLAFASKRPARVIASLLDGSQQGFRVRVVVGDPWSGNGSEHTHLLQPWFQRRLAHGILEDQRRLVILVSYKMLGRR